jgi:hypothetical protein
MDGWLAGTVIDGLMTGILSGERWSSVRRLPPFGADLLQN